MVATKRWSAGLVGLILLVAATGIASGNGVRTLLVEAVRPGLEITVDRGCGATYDIGDTLDVTVRSRLTGYLTLYDFTSDGLVHQIYPNQYHADNFIQADVDYTIPGNLLPFIFRVAEPSGEEILFGVVTDRPYVFLPEQFLDSSQAFPQIMLGDEEAAEEMTENLGVLPSDMQTAVALCYFQVAEAQEPTPSFDYSVSRSPTSGTVTRGDSISTTVRGRRTAGTSTQVGFSITGLPSGVTASVSSWSWKLGDESRTVTFSVGTNAPLGSHTITIRGTGGGVTRTTTFRLTVQAQETTPEPKNEGEVYGLFIAISDYIGDTDADFPCPAMQNTVQLIQDSIGSFFDHTKQLDDEEATRTGILAVMRSFLGQAGPEDTVYFHFAGHGIQVDDEDGDETDGLDEAIAPYDAIPGVASSMILDDEIWEIISNLDAGRAILVFESCHSGTAERGLVSSSLFSMPGTRTVSTGGTMIDDLNVGMRSANIPAVLALQASDASESSWLWCGGNGTSGLTYFAEGLADAFGESSQNADTNGDGWVSFQEAFRLAKAHVQEKVEEAEAAGDIDAGTTQTPVMSDGIGEPVNAVEVE